MTLWYCKTGQDKPSAEESSALARALLRHAFRQDYGGELPKIEKTEQGKPYFPDFPEIYFSMSHSENEVLCALAENPVGCDIQKRRSLRPGFTERLTTERERQDFEFFELWTLRESLFKMNGWGSLRHDHFCREGEKIIAPLTDANCRLYSVSPDSACAACLLGAEPCREIKVVSFEALKHPRPF